jgi:hypothetical protein
LGSDEFRPEVKRLFDLPIDDLLLKQLAYLELWLERVQAEQAFVLTCPKRQRIRRQHLLMEQYFRMRAPSNIPARPPHRMIPAATPKAYPHLCPIHKSPYNHRLFGVNQAA